MIVVCGGRIHTYTPPVSMCVFYSNWCKRWAALQLGSKECLRPAWQGWLTSGLNGILFDDAGKCGWRAHSKT